MVFAYGGLISLLLTILVIAIIVWLILTVARRM